MEQDSMVNLKWDAHQATLKSVFDSLLDAESLADCTVGAEGQHLKAHKIMLSACSPYFELLFTQYRGKHTVIVLPGVQFHILKALMIFMYHGEVVIPQGELDTLLKLSDFLQVKGLSYAGNVVSKKKQAHERRNKSPTYSEHTSSHCGVSPLRCEHCHSPELLEVSDDSSHSECLQEQDFTKAPPISTPDRKRKKSSWHSSWEEPPLKQGLVPLLQTVIHQVQRPDMFSGQVSRSSLTSQLSDFTDENFCEQTLSGEELILAKHLNLVVKTSVCPTVSEEKHALQTLTETKQENSSGLNEDHVPDLKLDTDDTQHQKICDDNNVIMSESSFCDERSFTQQMQFHVAGRTPSDLPHQISVSDNQFKCPSCSRSYRRRTNFLRHVNHECGKEPRFQCPVCLARYMRKEKLNKHMIRYNHYQ